MKKLLIVDDNDNIREIITVTLRDLGKFEIIEAKSGEEAVKVALEEMPELIFMDIMMPGEFDGLEATKRIKNDPKTKDTKIVMLTAMGQQSDIDDGIKAGADDYFIKPFSPMALMKKVDEVLKL